MKTNGTGALSWINAGSGDVVLAATQTFTGQNTFEGVASGIGLWNPGDFKWKISQSSVCGTGWLRADGSSKSTTTYSALFAELGYMFGGSGADFTLPDMNNGEFIRAVSTGTDGGNLTAGQGTKQLDSFQGHFHNLALTVGSTGTGAALMVANAASNENPTARGSVQSVVTDEVNGTPRTSTETRPRNYGMIPCIYSGVK